MHAKDCRIDRANTALNGVLDAKSYTRELERSWIFRTVGYGNDALVWKDIVSNLRLVGYDHVLSIEHEDSVMSPAEGPEEGGRVPARRGHCAAEGRGVLGVGQGRSQKAEVGSKFEVRGRKFAAQLYRQPRQNKTKEAVELMFKRIYCVASMLLLS